MGDAKEYLLQVQRLDADIDYKLEEVAKLRALRLKITTTLREDVVFTSGTKDRIGEITARIMEYETEIDKDIDALIDKKREIDAFIGQLKDVDQITVLRKLYIFREKWENIGREMYMSERNAQRIHGRALQVLNNLMKEEKNVEYS